MAKMVEELETAERIMKVQRLMNHRNVVSVLKVPRNAMIKVPSTGQQGMCIVGRSSQRSQGNGGETLCRWGGRGHVAMLLGQHGQVGHIMHCTFFGDIITVCLYRKPGGKITILFCRDIFVKLLPILKPTALNSNPPCVQRHCSQRIGGGGQCSVAAPHMSPRNHCSQTSCKHTQDTGLCQGCFPLGPEGAFSRIKGFCGSSEATTARWENVSADVAGDC